MNREDKMIDSFRYAPPLLEEYCFNPVPAKGDSGPGNPGGDGDDGGGGGDEPG